MILTHLSRKGQRLNIHFAMQILTARYSRRLITMEKVKRFDESESVPPISPEIEENLNTLSANVYETREEKATRPKFRSKLT